MDSINIGSNNAGDAFYRYKMPKLLSKVEGRGNGVKTNIVNMVEIAKALGRPASYTTKYFGCELGAQSKHVPDSGLSLVNGAHDGSALSQVLEGFIKKFVQCYSCSNPETIIEVDKRENITLTCKACGFVSRVDPRHKLNTFIIKNPPKASKKKKVEDKMRRADKEREEIGEAIDAEQRLKEKGKKKKDKDGKEKKEKKEKKKKSKESAVDEDVNSPRKNGNSVSALAEKVDEIKLSPEEERINHIREMVSEKKSSKDIAKYALKGMEGPHELDMRMKHYVEAILGNCSKSYAEYIVKHSKYFKNVAQDEKSQLALLVGFEHLVGITKTDHVKEMPLVLKALYDVDAADEDIIIKWYNNPKVASSISVDDGVAQTIRKHASPFVTWLETAEEDESSEDEE